uniref:Uncharacterized protein n=1 Tax=viral metagenome TaxID=1070528 RepID=A0A6C0KX44_9ZZZZ
MYYIIILKEMNITRYVVLCLNLLYCKAFIFKKNFLGVGKLFENKQFMFNKMNVIKTKEEKYEYYEDWSCGEVPWELESQVHTIIIPTKTRFVDYDSILNSKNSLCVTSSVIKVLYKDILNEEALLEQLVSIDLSNYLFDSLGLFSLFGVISYGYRISIKNEMEFIKKQKKNYSKKKITLREIKSYLTMQKMIKTFVFMLLLVLTKNVKGVE